MNVLCGWASIDERGKASGGAAGDQTGKEVKTGPWYDFGQTVVLRPNDRAKGREMAAIMKKLCANNHIGYDQSQRKTLWSVMSRVGFDPDKVTVDCETDCSALIAVVCTAAGYNVSPDVWTGNLRVSLSRTRSFTALTDEKFTRSSSNLVAGDIILNPSKHVIMALEDGPDAEKFGWVQEDKYWYYYENGEPVKGKWRKDSVAWCYLGGDGRMVTNSWQTDGTDKWCYLGKDGRQVKGRWVKTGDYWYYVKKSGYMAENEWVSHKGDWFYLKPGGKMAVGAVTVQHVFGADGKCER